MQGPYLNAGLIHKAQDFFAKPLPKLLLKLSMITVAAIAALGLLNLAIMACPPIQSLVLLKALIICCEAVALVIAIFAGASIRFAVKEYLNPHPARVLRV